MSGKSDRSSNPKKAYLLVTRPKDLIGVDAARQLGELPQTSRVYLAFPRDHEGPALATLRKLNEQRRRLLAQPGEDGGGDLFQLVWFDAASACTKENPGADAETLIIALKGSNVHFLDGVLLNSHGAGGLKRGEDGGAPRPHTGLIPLAEKKLYGNNLLLDSLIESGMVSTGSRVVYAGTEAARGLAKMGFPAPHKLQPSPESMQSYLNGSGYEQPFQLEHAYSYIGAILALYVGALAQHYPNVYFATVSPGLTQESFDPENHAHPSVFDRLLMCFYLYVLFPLVLKPGNIAHDYSVGASYFVRAMTGTHEWAPPPGSSVSSACQDDGSRDYESGSFVGALELTSGPIGDQYHVPNGAIFRHKAYQKAAYEAVRRYLETK